MKKVFLSFIAGLIVLIFGCSKKSNNTAPIIPDPVPPAAGLTKQNVRTYMVDANASAETVALFYNLKTVASRLN